MATAVSCTGPGIVCNLGYIALVCGIFHYLTPSPRGLLVAMEPKSQTVTAANGMLVPMLCNKYCLKHHQRDSIAAGKLMHRMGLVCAATHRLIDGWARNIAVRSNAINGGHLMEPGANSLPS